ncbi:MAG: hypothetical protein HC883_03155 [Bdellovibrionaceae bacterium]|nr:hypothetical protein [Pseudobdellovibrionaceae bacterium]
MAIVRVMAYSNEKPGMLSASLDLNRLVELPLTLVDSIGFYLEKFLVPTNLSVVYPTYSWTPESWLRLMVFLGFVGIARFLWRRGHRYEVLVFGGIFILLLLPALPVVPRINYINDRYAYLAIIGPAGLIGTVLMTHLPNNIWRYAWIVLALVAAIPSTHVRRSGKQTRLSGLVFSKFSRTHPLHI